MSKFLVSPSLLCAVGVLCLPGLSRAANYTTKAVQGSGQSWTAAIWQLDGTGTAVAPTAGNTYELVSNGTAVGNNLNETRTRNPAAAGVQTFPGDSLTLNTNTEIRMKTSGAILNFPGVSGKPGLILNGGMLNSGDDAVFEIRGSIQVIGQSYLCPGNNDGANAVAARAMNISGKLSGNGTLVLFEAATNNAIQMSGNSNTFSGQWIVKSGWLLGSGTNSLGTNNITINPAFVLPVPPFSDTAPVVDVAGPAVLDVNYTLISAGTLTLVNGGLVRLDQDCAFSAVSIEGVALSAGFHPYSELAANYPNNFPVGGSGSITVQPYGMPLVIRPVVAKQPMPQMRYAGQTVRFSISASGTAPFSYQWRKASANLTDGGNISGATQASLVISNISDADVGAYDVVVSNSAGSVTSSQVNLTIVAPSGEAYETAVIAANPTAFYQLNETTDPATSPLAFDYAGGFNGTYGIQAQNGNATYNIAGPLPANGFPGFSSGNKAALFANPSGASQITVVPWNLNTNTVTITAWINPSLVQSSLEGIVFCRGAGTVAGLNYSASTDISGNPILGYTWNNEADTFNWNSGLVAPPGQWSLAALVVTSTNATIHLMNANGLASSTHVYNHLVQSFGGTTMIGDDSGDGGNGARVFNGTIDDVAIFNKALTQSQLASLYSAASGVKNFSPFIAAQPESQMLYAQQTAQFKAASGGTESLSYQWQKSSAGSFVNVTDGGRISGAKTPTLTISAITAADGADYQLVISNAYGTTNSTPANLTVLSPGPAERITMSVQQVAGADWNTGADWSDGLAASGSAASKSGSTYELLAGARLRTPAATTYATFPGNVLTLNGDGVWNLNPAAGATISEIRFKQPNPGSVTFKKLVMNGGQLDTGNDGVVVIGGEINILTNAPFNNDSGNDRGYQVDALLSGFGTIEYHGYNQTSFMPNYVNNLNFTCNSNTFSGKWNIITGVLLGTGNKSLGTNDIIVGANGALETTYDINNPDGNLILNGKMYLHQKDTFRAVTINGTPLAPGTFTFAQLTSQFPNNFPAAWTPQTGATTFGAGSGSLIVLGLAGPLVVTQPASQSVVAGQPVKFTVAVTGSQPLTYQWRTRAVGSLDFVNLTDNARVSGSTTTNLVISNLTSGDAGDYVVVISNAAGSATSNPATLTVNPPGNYTTIVVQATGADWNGAIWLPNGTGTAVAPVPGNTYELVANGTSFGNSLANTRVRNPAFAGVQTFPGNSLTLNTNTELRMKQLGAILDFPGVGGNAGLILNGGVINAGDTAVFTVTGKVRVDSESYLCMGDNGGGGIVVGRAINLACQLTGTGALVLFQSATNDSNTISGGSNTFSGQWIVKAGWLLASGANSLGTNSITIDPGYVLSLDPGITDVPGPAVLEAGYDVNSAGMLTLTNGGLMRLHQNCVFSAVTIEGVKLSPGTHPYAELLASFPNNFEAGGSGSITVGVLTPPVTLVWEGSGSNRKLNWSQGTLLEATNVLGPWTTNNATPPFPVTPTGPMKFYKVRVK